MLWLSVLLAFPLASQAQLTVTNGQTAAALAQKLVGQGVTISNVTLTCPSNANGIFVGQSNLGLDSGIVLTSGNAASSGGTIGVNGAQAIPSAGNSAPGDADLSALTGKTTNDACVLEFDFIPFGDTIKFDYVFGSAEYFGFSCSDFNDVFGFFISGPGIVGNQNIARIPGTTVPVSVNSTTNPLLTNPGSTTQCTSIGWGSPFSQYFVDNTNGTTVTYRGFTTAFRALSAVTPCQTYHLKLAIADATDFILDSGVFLKAGSLTSEALQISPLGGGGLTAPAPYAVRGCLPGQFKFRRPTVRSTPLTIFYQIGGTATNGVDYGLIPDSVVIPANDSIATINIQAFTQATPQPAIETVKLRIFAPGCGSNTGIIVDSTVLEIRDSFQVAILTPDTIICRGQTVPIRVSADPLLSFSWSPAVGLSATNVQQPAATPLTTTLYNAVISLPGAGCANISRKLLVTVRQPPIVNAGPDTTTCVGAPYTFPTTVTTAVAVNQPYSYTWTPAAGLSSATAQNPSVTPAAAGTTSYIVRVSVGAPGCERLDTVRVRALPNSIDLQNADTAICQGASVQVRLEGDPAFSYQWYPNTGVSDPAIRRPVLQPTATTDYSVTASFPGCPPIVRQLAVDVQPNPVANIGPDRDKCQWDTLQLRPLITPEAYPAYTYSWTPATAVEDPTVKNTLLTSQSSTMLTLTVKTPAGCIGSDDARYTVYQGNFASLAGPADTGICPGAVLSYRASGGASYQWSPDLFLSPLSRADSPDIVAQPVTDVTYAVLVTDAHGCFDTLYSVVDVYPAATLHLPDSVILYPGDSVQLSVTGNATSYSWFPPQDLSASTISNPVARPTVNTRYFVTGVTESGCVSVDSVDVLVRAESILNLPNAFAPGAGPNGVFKIVKEGLATLRYFRIFNRWGTKVFETTNLETGWDGTYNGEPQPMGVYIYDVEAVTSTGRRFTQQGNLTLIR